MPKVQKTEEKRCLVCGEKFRGRQDKRFCSDQCRATYNNRENSDANNYIRNVNNILRKNRRILTSLNPSGKIKVSREKLMEEGFNFNYYTSTYTTRDHSCYFYCYDQGYLEVDKNHVLLVVKKEY